MARLLAFFVLVIIVLAAIYTFKVSKDFGVHSEKANVEENLTTFDFQDWHEFTAPNNAFKVLMPSLPQHATENIKDKNTGESRKYEMYFSEKADGSIFMISVIGFSAPLINGEKEVFLRTMMNDAIESNPNNKLLKVESGKYKEYDSLDYSLENTETHIDTKTFFVNDTLYALTRLVKMQNHNAKEFDFFINSFDLSSGNTKSTQGKITK